MMNKAVILSRYAQRQVSPEEQQAFQEWLGTLSPEEVEEVIHEYAGIVASLPDLPDSADPDLLLSIHKEIAMKEEMAADQSTPHIPFMRGWRWAAAAAIILALSVTIALWFNRSDQPTVSEKTQPPVQEIAPGKAGAVLTLADGSQVVLDSLQNGRVAQQNGSEVVLQNGQLVYGPAATSSADIVYNTMTTPRGRQFELTLPDGTHVWLNAASSIRYPTVFTGKERKVELNGEAYFEVVKNAAKPFRVNALNKAAIEVLGTEFNVSAYSNERSINTTLLEGSVQVNGTIIKPGQQAQVTEKVRVIDKVALDKVMAWQKGFFNFEGASLEEVMQQLERWYDIDVVYENGIPAVEFGGEMTRNMSLSGVLIALEKSGVRYRLEGRKLIVLPR